MGNVLGGFIILFIYLFRNNIKFRKNVRIVGEIFIFMNYFRVSCYYF